jgi:exonuclease SbcD
MRILHTSDWHIGRTFHGNATLVALRGVLDALVAEVRDRDVDVVVVAGDVFDSAAPAGDCYTLLTDMLVALRETGAHVIVTSGNHDSAARLGFQARLLRDGIHVLTDPAELQTPVTIDDAHGPVHFYGIPYLEPALVRRQWPGVRSQAQALARAMELVQLDAAVRGGRSVVAAHCFAAGVEATPHLERDIQQGGLDVVPLSVFDGPDYVALGHIHGRSTLSERVRYAGAPLHYSFGERDKPRGAWLVEMDAAGLAGVEWVALPVPRALAVIEGPLEDLLTDARFAHAEDAWVSARYTDSAAQVDPMRRLQRRFAHCAEVRHAPAQVAAADTRSFGARVAATRSDAELVDAFLAHVRNGDGLADDEVELVRDVLDEHTVAEVTA